MAGVASLPLLSNADEITPPNVVYVFSDEHRWHSMSFTEQTGLLTPNMAQLAQQGMSFTHCISNYPVCSPHRAMLMTGRWPYQQGVIDNGISLNSNEMTIGKAFQQAGYTTGYVGKWHLGGTRAEPFGFDLSLIWTGTNNHWDSKYYPAGADPVQVTGQYNATAMTDQALDFVEANQSQPFFLMLSLNPPHELFSDAPQEKKDLYPDELTLPIRANVPIDDKEWTNYRNYHAHVSAIDDELGRIMAKLGELNLTNNTILIYSSDHGSMLKSNDLTHKRYPHAESIRVPFVAQWPGVIPAETICDALFGTIDIMPTVCGLAGIGIPDSCVGLDFSDWLRGQTGPRPLSQFIMHLSANYTKELKAPFFRGVITERYTYAYREAGQAYPDPGPYLLFDNQLDPYQTNNLVDDPPMERVRNQLEAMVYYWLHEAEDLAVDNHDVVDLEDFSNLAQNWGAGTDITDLADLAERWLEGKL